MNATTSPTHDLDRYDADDERIAWTVDAALLGRAADLDLPLED